MANGYQPLSLSAVAGMMNAQRQQAFKIWDQRKEMYSLATGLEREAWGRQWARELTQVRDPAIKKYATDAMKGSLVDPVARKLYFFDKHNPKQPMPDTSNMTDDMASVALADWFEQEHARKRSRGLVTGKDIGELGSLQAFGEGKVYFRDIRGNGRVLPIEHFNIEENITKMNSTDTIEGVLNRGRIRSPKIGETVFANGSKRFVYEELDIKTGKKSLHFESAGVSPRTTGSGVGGLGKEAAKRLRAYTHRWILPDDIDIDEYEGPDKQVLADILDLKNRMNEATSDLDPEAAWATKKEIIADFFEPAYHGVVATIVDGKKFQQKGILGSMFGPNVEYAPGSETGVLAMMPGKRFSNLYTQDKQPFEAILSPDGRVYDTDFQYFGKRFVGDDGLADEEAFVDWVRGNTFEKLSGRPMPVVGDKKPTAGLTLGDVNRFMAAPWVKMWYSLDALTWKVIDAYRNTGRNADPKIIQQYFLERTNKYNQVNLKDAFDVLIKIGMSVEDAVESINSWEIPFTEGLGG